MGPHHMILFLTVNCLANGRSVERYAKYDSEEHLSPGMAQENLTSSPPLLTKDFPEEEARLTFVPIHLANVSFPQQDNMYIDLTDESGIYYMPEEEPMPDINTTDSNGHVLEIDFVSLVDNDDGEHILENHSDVLNTNGSKTYTPVNHTHTAEEFSSLPGSQQKNTKDLEIQYFTGIRGHRGNIGKQLVQEMIEVESNETKGDLHEEPSKFQVSDEQSTLDWFGNDGKTEKVNYTLKQDVPAENIKIHLLHLPQEESQNSNTQFYRTHSMSSGDERNPNQQGTYGNEKLTGPDYLSFKKTCFVIDPPMLTCPSEQEGRDFDGACVVDYSCDHS